MSVTVIYPSVSLIGTEDGGLTVTLALSGSDVHLTSPTLSGSGAYASTPVPGIVSASQHPKIPSAHAAIAKAKIAELVARVEAARLAHGPDSVGNIMGGDAIELWDDPAVGLGDPGRLEYAEAHDDGSGGLIPGRWVLRTNATNDVACLTYELGAYLAGAMGDLGI